MVLWSYLGWIHEATIGDVCGLHPHITFGNVPCYHHCLSGKHILYTHFYDEAQCDTFEVKLSAGQAVCDQCSWSGRDYLQLTGDRRRED